MSEWESRIRNHRVWALMKALGPSIDKALETSGIESSTLQSIERLRVVLSFCGKRLGASDPLTVLPSTLDALAGAFETQATELAGFLNDANVAHVNGANASADAALAIVAQLPGVSSSEEVIGLVEAANNYRATLEEHERAGASARARTNTQVQELTRVLDTFKNQTETTLADLRTQLESEKQKISVQSLEQQRLFVEAQSSRGATYNETIAKIQETLTKTLSDQQAQFSTAQENRNAQFTALQGEYTKKLAEQDAQFSKELIANVETWKRI